MMGCVDFLVNSTSSVQWEFPPMRKFSRACMLQTTKAVKNTIQIVKQKVVEAYHDVGVHPDANGILDIEISFDGSWQKRGYISHNGVAAIIDGITGLVLDFVALSN